MINDISEMKPTFSKSTIHIQKAIKCAMDKGVDKEIRVVRNPISEMQMSRLARGLKAHFRVMDVSSLEEALRLNHNGN